MKYVIAYDQHGKAIVATCTDNVSHMGIAQAMKRDTMSHSPDYAFHLYSAGFFQLKPDGTVDVWGSSESLRGLGSVDEDAQTLLDHFRNIEPRKKSKEEIHGQGDVRKESTKGDQGNRHQKGR